MAAVMIAKTSRQNFHIHRHLLPVTTDLHGNSGHSKAGITGGRITFGCRLNHGLPGDSKVKNSNYGQVECSETEQSDVLQCRFVGSSGKNRTFCPIANFYFMGKTHN